MSRSGEKKGPENLRSSKKRFSITREIASRKMSNSNIFSEDSKIRMLGSRHSVSSIKSKNKLNISKNQDLLGESSSFSSDSESENKASRQSIIIRDNIGSTFQPQQSFNFAQDKLIIPNMSFENDFINPLDISDGIERSILKIQFIDFEHRWGMKQDIMMQKQCGGDSMLMSQVSDGLVSQKSIKKSVKSQKHAFHSKLQGSYKTNKQQITESEDDYSENQQKEDKLEKKYNKLYERNPFEDPYYVKLKDLHGFERLNYEIDCYHDDKQFLKLRKNVVYYSLFIPILCKNIVKSVFFKIIMSFLIIFNVTLYIYSQTMQDPQSTKKMEVAIMICFLIELFLRIIASGVIIPKGAFFRNFQDIFDCILVIVYALNLTQPDIFIVDISPLRIITLLLYLGDIFQGLGVMLKALKQSLKFLLEALMIVGLFSVFFATCGVFLFQGLFNYRCTYDNGDETDGWVQCNQSSCYEEGMSCTYSSFTPKLPTSFNNVIYAYGQVLRTITMDDWSWVMFFTIRIYHPWTWIYYVLIIFVCGFFGFNLVIAVIKIHYAEAAEENAQEEEKRLIEQKIKENKEIQERDIINVFDVAFLRYREFFPVIQRYRQALKTTYRSIKLEEHNERAPQGKTRILSAKQRKNEENNIQKSLFERWIYKIQSLTLKNILLPKFLILQEKQKSLNVKKYTEDEIEIQILERLLSFQISQLQSCVNEQIEQHFISEADVLPTLNLPDCEKKEQEKDIINMRQIKLPIFYPDIRKTKKFSAIINAKEIIKFPVRKVKRVILEQRDDIDDFLNKSIEENIQNQKNSVLQSHKLKASNVENKVPFALKKQDKIFVHIQGYYLDFEQLQKKIDFKIPKNKLQQSSNEFQYRLLRKKDFQQNVIAKKNWSGIDVLKLNNIRLHSFSDILKKLNEIDIQIWMLGIKGKIDTLKKYSKRLLTSQISQLFFDCVILINFTFLSLQGIADSQIISQEEDVSTIFLCVELVLRFFSFSLQDIARNTDSLLQSCIVILNFIELTMSSLMTDLNEQNLRLIRGTKCLLFYRVLKYNKMAVVIGHIAQKTFKQYIYLTFLMFLVIFIYAMIGMEMYAGQFDQTDTLGQLHSYDNILKGFMTIFNIMTNDDWYGVYVMGGNINYIFAVIYSYSMVIVLNYITYGLVLAILLDGFGAINKEMREEEEEEVEEEVKNDDNQEEQKSIISDQQEIQDFHLNLKPLISQANLENQQKKKSKSHLISNLMKSIKQVHVNILREYPKLYEGIHCEQSLYLFTKENYFRILCCRFVTSYTFTLLIDINLYFSIIVFALKTYNDYESDSQNYPEILQFIANIIFMFEITIGSIAKGMWMNKGCYITYTWQIVDVIYIISFFINFAQDSEKNAPIIDFFLYFGYFRVMKVMYRISWLETLRSALGKSLADIWNVFLTMLSIWIIFGVYGIILYEQQFGFCDDKMSFNINQKQCLSENRTWINYKHNFDNITIALPTLFVVSTFDGWGEIMQIAENSQNSQIGPEPFNSYITTYFFFISFCFIGSMFFFSLFTGVLYSNLKTNQSKLELTDITKAQQEFMGISQIIIKDFPLYSSPPTSTLRKFAADITNDFTIQKTMFCLLLMDLIVILLFFSEMSDELFYSLNVIHNTLTYIYILWNILLFLALGINRYFDNNWRRFYFFLITVAIIDIIADYETDWALVYFRSSPFDTGYQFLRIFFMIRCLRIILIFQGLINLQRLMRVMVFAMPFLGKIFTLLMLTMVIFALIGCQLYGQLESGQVMDNQINFTNFAQALLALFKSASGDDWRTIMTDTMFYNPNCSENSIYCGSIYNQIYFFLFMLLSNYVLLNLFVLGLVEQFEQFFQLQNSMIQTYVENVDKIKTVWCKYSSDTQGQAMHYKFLCRFLMDIGKPLGGSKDENLWDVGKLASSFKLQCDHFGYIQYNQLMYELFRVCYHQDVFKNGSTSSIKKIKQFNKEMQLRLMYYRRNRFLQRSNISPILHLKANFNILHDYLTVLIMFKAWETFSKKLIKKLAIKQQQFTDSDMDEQDSSFDKKTVNYIDQDCNEFLEDDLGQQIVSNDNTLENKQEQKHFNTNSSDENGKQEDIPVYQWQKDQQTGGVFDQAIVIPEKKIKKIKY